MFAGEYEVQCIHEYVKHVKCAHVGLCVKRNASQPRGCVGTRDTEPMKEGITR